MKRVSLTPFMDFVGVAGRRKRTIVQEWMVGDYDPRTDYYKRVREGIRDTHEDGLAIDDLHTRCAPRDPKKIENYKSVVTGYKRWARKLDLEWFAPIRADWRCDDLTVSVNPELGLSIDGVRHLVKLYFRQDPLPKEARGMVLHLMQRACCGKSEDPARAAVLDVRRGKLWTSTAPNDDFQVLLEGEAACWQKIAEKM